MRNKISTGRLSFFEMARFLWHLPTLGRLLFRLLGDSGVTFAGKFFFFAALAFIVSPFDVPNYVPVLGEMSDLMLALLACRWFINSCPAGVVAAHLTAIRGRVEQPALSASPL